MQLTATRLLGIEDHLLAEPLQHANRRAHHPREHRVAQARREQRYPHRRLPSSTREPTRVASAADVDRVTRAGSTLPDAGDRTRRMTVERTRRGATARF